MTRFKRITRMTTRTKTAALAAGALSLLAFAGPAFAQAGGAFPEQSGAEIYGAICQGCHMPDGKGGQGSAITGYPALAGNKKLAAKAYPAMVITRGQKAMPEFGSMLSDVQVANVINYIRTNFGNTYTDAITPEQVKPMRPVKAAAGNVRPPG
jgi:mono/diheme cytochrome c family protein